MTTQGTSTCPVIGDDMCILGIDMQPLVFLVICLLFMAIGITVGMTLGKNEMRKHHTQHIRRNR